MNTTPRNVLQILLLTLLLLLPVPATFLAGASLLALPLILLILLGIHYVRRPSTWTRFALLLGLLGSIIGTGSAIQGLLAVGGLPDYSERVGYAFAAILFALLAGGASLKIPSAPQAGAGVMLVAGIIGFVLMSLYYINAYYFVALLLWWVATFAAFLEPDRATTRERAQPAKI